MDTKVVVDSIVDNRYRQGEKQAMIRMEVHTGGSGNNLKDSLYTAEELGRQTFVEKRVDWLDVKPTDTVESVQALIDSFPKARIYKILSNKPVFNDNQKRVIKYGLQGEAFEEFKTTHGIVADEWNQECADKMEKIIADSQIVRYGENNTEGKPADEPVLDRKGQIQYRLTLFNKSGREDIDLRTGVPVLGSLALAENPSYVPAEQEAAQ